MDDFDEIIGKLRTLVDERHETGHKAIDDLVASLAGPALPAVPGRAHARNGSTARRPKDDRTNVDKVLDAIRKEPKTVDEIASETGLTEKNVRGALGGKPVKRQVVSDRIAKKVRYVVATAADTLKELKQALTD